MALGAFNESDGARAGVMELEDGPGALKVVRGASDTVVKEHDLILLVSLSTDKRNNLDDTV
jgi:hypothetical protein